MLSNSLPELKSVKRSTCSTERSWIRLQESCYGFNILRLYSHCTLEPAAQLSKDLCRNRFQGIVSLESFPGLLKRLQIWALFSSFCMDSTVCTVYSVHHNLKLNNHPLEMGSTTEDLCDSLFNSFWWPYKICEQKWTKCQCWNLKTIYGGYRNRVRIGGLLYRTARLHRLVESIPGLLTPASHWLDLTVLYSRVGHLWLRPQ
jgi:hypothetical protein